MKGTILAGGSGTCLYPIAKGASKRLLPVYGKPMIYYPLPVLMLTGIHEILVIPTPQDLPGLQRLLGNGSSSSINPSYAEQPSLDGLAQAFITGKDFIGNDDVYLVLGDNILYGQSFSQMLTQTIYNAEEEQKVTVFGCRIKDPEHYGVAEFGAAGNVLSIEEKPTQSKSNHAIVGPYFYPNRVVKVTEEIKSPARGELEIVSADQEFLKDEELKVKLLGRGLVWLDTGTRDSLSEASSFIETLEKRQGLKISCPEEIAPRKGWISAGKLRELIQSMIKNQYGQYLLQLIIDS